MDATELAFAGLARQAELVRAGEVSSRELVEVCLTRIARLDLELNAFRAVLTERALTEADQADARRTAGDERPLLGVPVAIKDNTDVAGEPTTHGTGAYGAPAERDAVVVERLRAAGAIVIGTTRVPELCLWPFTESATWGVTRNPWDLSRTPGGSSGGSGAAVAAGLVGAALGTDGGGSIRIPAAACGLFGLKPQRDRVSLAPHVEDWHGLSVAGGLGRRVADVALFDDVVAGPAPSDRHAPPPLERPLAEAARSTPGKLRIAFTTKPPIPQPLDEAARRAVHETADVLRSLGHEVRERNPDWGFPVGLFLPRYLRGAYDDAHSLPHPDRLERRTRAIVRMGSLVSPKLLARSRAAEAGYARKLNAIFDDHDVLLTPAFDKPPIRIGRWEGRGAVWTLNGAAQFVPFFPPFNVTGQPAATVPSGFTPEGLPVAVQMAGRPNDEDTLVSLAAQLEAERPWADRIPPVAA